MTDRFVMTLEKALVYSTDHNRLHVWDHGSGKDKALFAEQSQVIRLLQGEVLRLRAETEVDDGVANYDKWLEQNGLSVLKGF